jgi:cytochrome c
MTHTAPIRITTLATAIRSSWLAAIAMAAPVAHADDQKVAYGEYLSGECVTCHRLSGEVNGIPSIIGWSPDQFLAVMHAYKFKARDNVTMQTIAARLTEDEIAALAAFFSNVKRP